MRWKCQIRERAATMAVMIDSRVVVLAAVLLVSCSAPAHDLYLVAGIKGAEGRVCARIGEEFPASTNAVTADRLEFFRLRTQSGVAELKGEVEGEQFCAKHNEAVPALAEMQVHPRFIKLEGKLFSEYIHGEGFNKVMQARQRTGKSGEPGRELYSRYAKLLLGNSADFTKPIGHALEIVPERDPAALKPQEPLAVRVFFRGKPLADAQVAAVYAGAVMKGHEFPVTTRTDANGRAELKLDRPGLWYARLIHMVPAQGDPDVDWRSFFATLTFTVPE